MSTMTKIGNKNTTTKPTTANKTKIIVVPNKNEKDEETRKGNLLNVVGKNVLNKNNVGTTPAGPGKQKRTNNITTKSSLATTGTFASSSSFSTKQQQKKQQQQPQQHREHEFLTNAASTTIMCDPSKCTACTRYPLQPRRCYPSIFFDDQFNKMADGRNEDGDKDKKDGDPNKNSDDRDDFWRFDSSYNLWDLADMGFAPAWDLPPKTMQIRKMMKDPPVINLEVGNRIADRAGRQIRRLDESLPSSSMLPLPKQQPRANSMSALMAAPPPPPPGLGRSQSLQSQQTQRIIAPYDRSEISVGRLLGTGGFSHVFEIISLQPADATDNIDSSLTPSIMNAGQDCERSYDSLLQQRNPSDHSTSQHRNVKNVERAARLYLKDHCRRKMGSDLQPVIDDSDGMQRAHESSMSIFSAESMPPEFNHQDQGEDNAAINDLSERLDRSHTKQATREQDQKSRKEKNKSGRDQDEGTFITTRYALKHLKYGLDEECREREEQEKNEVADKEGGRKHHKSNRFEEAAIDIVREAQILAALDHPNIIRLHGWSAKGHDVFRTGKYTDYFMILDKLHETLEDRLHSWHQSLRKYKARCFLPGLRKRISWRTLIWGPWSKTKYMNKIERLWTERVRVAHDMACAVSYLHDRGIINRDLKSSNVGFDIHNELKIFDFGLSVVLPNSKNKILSAKKASSGHKELEPIGDDSSISLPSSPDGLGLGEEDEDNENDDDVRFALSRVGTKFYMAPEVRGRQPYNLSADVYSYGVVLWEILALSTPRDVFRRIKPNRRNSKVSTMNADHAGSWLPICPCWPDVIRDIVKKCLSADPSERPTMNEVRTTLESYLADIDTKQSFEPKQRRRSTFRLDLSGMGGNNNHHNSNITDLLAAAMEDDSTGIDRSCYESKTSHCSSSAFLESTTKTRSMFSKSSGQNTGIVDPSKKKGRSDDPDNDGNNNSTPVQQLLSTKQQHSSTNCLSL